MTEEIKHHNITSKVYRRVCLGLCNIPSQRFRDKHVYPLINYAGITGDMDLYLGKKMLLAILIGLIGFLIPLNVPFVRETLTIELAAVFGAIIGLMLMMAVMAIFYLHIFNLIDNRKKLVEDILPDFLLLVSSNIQSGMTPFNAFRNSARKEFGPLSEEIKIATSKSLGTDSFSEALGQLSKRINSIALKETVEFFSQALRSGGRIAKLLETTAFDIRQTQALKKELVSSTKMYSMFVIFVVVIATPILLSVSVQFIDMISGIKEGTTIGSSSANTGFLTTDLLISSEFIQMMAFVFILGNSLLSSIFIGVIGEGNLKIGLKYFLPILFVSVIVFLTSRMVFSNFLGI